MKKIAVLIKDGFEEIEALSVIDIARRAGIQGDLIGMDSEYVTSSHQIQIKADVLFDNLGDYDAVVIPGGMPGAKNLQSDPRVLQYLQEMDKKEKFLCAICAGPIVLQAAGVLKGKDATCFPGFEEQINDAHYVDQMVVKDDHIITSRGPATSFAFGYTIIEALGIDSQSLQDGMQYTYLMKN